MMLPNDGSRTVSGGALLDERRPLVVAITGGASGIGKALAREFSKQPRTLVALLDIGDCQTALGELMMSGPLHTRHFAIPCDVTNEEQIKNAIHTIKQRWGRIDIYCSNAGIMFPPPPPTTTNHLESDSVTRHSNDQWETIWKVNVQSHVLAARELLPDWERGHGAGIFVITASAAGLLTQIGDVSYGVSKAAAISFAEHMAITHPTIQVHCICPQAVDTPFVVKIPRTMMTQNSAMSDGMVSAEHVAQCTLKAIEEGNFWVFPHPRVHEYVRRKATDHARWLKGMQKLRNRLQQGNGPVPTLTYSKL